MKINDILNKYSREELNFTQANYLLMTKYKMTEEDSSLLLDLVSEEALNNRRSYIPATSKLLLIAFFFYGIGMVYGLVKLALERY